MKQAIPGNQHKVGDKGAFDGRLVEDGDWIHFANSFLDQS